MEAENYLASGFLTRQAMQKRKAGWAPLKSVARTWQPSRLKGIQVSPEFGTPFLAATQVFDLRPIPRKWLSLNRTDDAPRRFVESGTILLTCSGNVGRATLAHSTISSYLISHDLLRIDALESSWWGWVYAYLRAPTVRAMMRSAQYGHIIKHLEVSHLDALPVLQASNSIRKEIGQKVQTIIEHRDRAHEQTLQAEKRFEDTFGPLIDQNLGEDGFAISASTFRGGRRRLDAFHHNPSVAQIEQHLEKSAKSWDKLDTLGYEVWLPNRFKRIAATDGVGLLDSSSLFEINPDVSRRIADESFGDSYNGRINAGWMLLARSGQIYGLIGSVALAGIAHEGLVISDDIIRIASMNAKVPTGYTFVALTHPTLGRPRLKALAYGSSIPHIEPMDVRDFSIPRLASKVENEIAELAEAAASLRSDADTLENEIGQQADELLKDFLSGGSAYAKGSIKT